MGGFDRKENRLTCLYKLFYYSKGICYEKQGNISSAIDAFSTAWDVVEQHLKEKSETLWYWIEECLYHGILLQLRTRYMHTYIYDV